MTEPAPVATAPPRLLATPGTYELVVEGQVHAFFVAKDAGGAASARRYLGTFERGDALFVHEPRSEAPGQIVATSSPGTTVAAHDLAALAARPADEAATLVEGYVRTLTKSLAGLPAPGAPERRAPSSEPATIDPGQTLRPEGAAVGWVRVLRGRATFHGVVAAEVVGPAPPIPLTEAGWLEALEELSVEVLGTRDVLARPEELAAALSHFELCVLFAAAEVATAERAAKGRQLKEKLQKSRYIAVEALAQISALLARSPTEAVVAETQPLFVAFAEAARFLGIEARAPGGSHDLARLQNPAEAIARASHVRTREVVLRPGWWREDSGALVGTLAESEDPIALLPVAPGRYELFDPKAGSRRRVDRAVAETLAPTALALYPPFPEGELGPAKLLAFSIRGRERDVVVAILLALVTAIIGLATPQATAILIDDAIPGGDRALLLQIGLVLLGLLVVSSAFQLGFGLLNLRIQSAADHVLQAGLWDHLLRLRMSFFRGFSSGDLQTRVLAVRQIRQTLSATVVKSLLTSGLALAQLGLLFWYSWQLALIGAAIFVFQTVATSFAGVLILRANDEAQTLEGAQFGLLVQLVNGITKLRVTGAERRAFSHWAKTFAAKQQLRSRVLLIQNVIATGNAALSVASGAAVFVAVQALLGKGSLTTGAFLAFFAAFTTFLTGASTLSETITTLLDVVNLAERAGPILRAKPEIDRGKVDPGALRGRVELDHVTFRYRAAGPLTLDSVSISAQPGELVALVGESGSGKSTIVKLLLGFESPESGTISFDDHDLQGLDVEAVRRQLGVVIQGGRIAQGSVFDNIAEGRVISIAEAEEAADAAGLADDLAAMPMGLHTVVSEGGTNLSGGQRQRLLIARAIATRPKILIFDEATSALDNRTQAIVNESLEALRVTRLVIAHRLSTIRKADRIYVLDKGRVVETGTFDELAKAKGPFSRLLARQTA